MAALDRTRLIGRLFLLSLQRLANKLPLSPSISNKADGHSHHDGDVRANDCLRADNHNKACDSLNNRSAEGGMLARRRYSPARYGNGGRNRRVQSSCLLQKQLS